MGRLVKPRSCVGCPLWGDGYGFSRIRGEGAEKVLIVPEALGEDEDAAGTAFVGRTGNFFQNIVTRTIDPESGRQFNMDRDFWVANTVRCRPPNNHLLKADYERVAIDRCKHFLDEAVAKLQPKAILAVGGIAMRELLGVPSVDKFRGFVFPTRYGIPGLGTFHPSYLVRGQFHNTRLVKLDLIRAVQIARHGATKRKTDYLLDPGYREALEWVEEYEKALAADPAECTLSFDIETPYEDDADNEKDEDPWDVKLEDDVTYTILRISFAYREGEAISFPWSEPFISLAKRLLASTGRKLGWNSLAYDAPRLELSGARINGEHVDGMLGWKCVEPSLRMSLKFVGPLLCADVEPWQLQSSAQPAFYNASDSDIALRCWNKIYARLKAEGRWSMFLRHFIKLASVLRAISLKGVRVDKAKRIAARDEFLTMMLKLVAELQEFVPDSVRPRKVFKTAIETLEKRKKNPLRREDLVLVDDEIEEVPKGWMIATTDGSTPGGFLIKTPKPPKKPRPPKTPTDKPAKRSSKLPGRPRKTTSAGDAAQTPSSPTTPGNPEPSPSAAKRVS